MAWPHSWQATAARIDRVAQIDGHRLRVEVVGQLSADVGDLHIVDLIVAQHLFGDFRTGESAGERHFGVFFEDVLQAGLYDVADYADHDNQHEHAHRGGVVPRRYGLRGVITALEQVENQQHNFSVSVSALRFFPDIFGPGFRRRTGLLFRIPAGVVCTGLLSRHQYYIINVHVGR